MLSVRDLVFFVLTFMMLDYIQVVLLCKGCDEAHTNALPQGFLLNVKTLHTYTSFDFSGKNFL